MQSLLKHQMKHKKKYYTAQGIITTLAGILVLGTINVLGHIFCSHVLDSFTAFAYSYGLEWLVYLSAAVTIIGLSVLMRDLYIKKKQKISKTASKTIKTIRVFYNFCNNRNIYIYFIFFWALIFTSERR